MQAKKKNRCFDCGQFVGEQFAGYENDRASDRGRLYCERCVARTEANQAHSKGGES